jgi:predicted  nucleic acid-binding Zn-ribbon protein
MKQELDIIKRHFLQKTEELQRIEKEWNDLEEEREGNRSVHPDMF